MGSICLRKHQSHNILIAEDIFVEEFGFIDASSRLIAFSEKPFVSYRVRRFCTRRETSGDCVEGVGGYDPLGDRKSVV